MALALASRQPAGLQSLLLVTPSPPVPEPIPHREREKLLAGHGQRLAAEKTLKNVVAAPTPKVIREQIIADDLRTVKPAWDAWLLQGSKEDISARMKTVVLPVHIIVGSDDRTLPPNGQTNMVLPYLRDATLEVVDGAGHLLPWEVPDEVTAFVRKNLPGNTLS